MLKASICSGLTCSFLACIFEIVNFIVFPSEIVSILFILTIVLLFGGIGFLFALLFIPFLESISAPLWLFIFIGAIVPALLLISFIWVSNHGKWPDLITSNDLYGLVRVTFMGAAAASITLKKEIKTNKKNV